MLQEIKSVAFSTTSEEGLPQSRIVDIMHVENNEIFFITARGKEFGQQLAKTPFVAIVAMTPEYQMIKLQGKVKHLDRIWVDKIIELNPMVEGLYPGTTREILEAFCIYEGKGLFFDLSKDPVTTIPFGVGLSEASFFRPFIHSSCTSCGICKKNCPMQCIKEGTPYEIETVHCMNCGLCMEKCPVNAIKRREFEV